MFIHKYNIIVYMRYCIFNRDDSFSKEMTLKIKSFLSIDSFFSFDEENPELIIVIGGDGTFLGAFHKYEDYFENKKFLSFNTGTIGYYNEFDFNDYVNILNSIKKGSFPSRNFSLLEYQDNENTYYSINEFIISGLIHNVEYDVYLDNEKFEQYFGMGLVISTSTGSMGYNRSINGPVVDIDNDGMIMTEIAAIRSKAYQPIGSPVVLSKERTLTFKERNNRSGSLLVDNILTKEKTSKEFSIKISDKKVCCYSKEKDPFVARLKKTMGF